eukprot:765232-Hanusia_phi.AAC.6
MHCFSPYHPLDVAAEGGGPFPTHARLDLAGAGAGGVWGRTSISRDGEILSKNREFALLVRLARNFRRNVQGIRVQCDHAGGLVEDSEGSHHDGGLVRLTRIARIRREERLHERTFGRLHLTAPVWPGDVTGWVVHIQERPISGKNQMLTERGGRVAFRNVGTQGTIDEIKLHDSSIGPISIVGFIANRSILEGINPLPGNLLGAVHIPSPALKPWRIHVVQVLLDLLPIIVRRFQPERGGSLSSRQEVCILRGRARRHFDDHWELWERRIIVLKLVEVTPTVAIPLRD